MPLTLSIWERLARSLERDSFEQDLTRVNILVRRVLGDSVYSIRDALHGLLDSRSTVSRALYSLLEFVTGALLFLLYYAAVFLLGAGTAEPYPNLYREEEE
ncbi:MAG: hypothetical protein MUC90_07795 [Thermoplasmata archaeon]|jgi:hypothetical protein|nr:hypothetical protein [Thermoplasmata archaeon]